MDGGSCRDHWHREICKFNQNCVNPSRRVEKVSFRSGSHVLSWLFFLSVFVNCACVLTIFISFLPFLEELSLRLSRANFSQQSPVFVFLTRTYALGVCIRPHQESEGMLVFPVTGLDRLFWRPVSSPSLLICSFRTAVVFATSFLMLVISLHICLPGLHCSGLHWFAEGRRKEEVVRVISKYVF